MTTGNDVKARCGLAALCGANPVEGRSADAVTARQFCAVDAGGSKLGLERGDLLRRQLRFGAELHAGSFGTGDALGGAFFDQVALELADGGEHVEQEAASRAGGVDGLVEDHEVDFLGSDLRRDLRQVQDGAGEAVEPRDDELVAVADKAQEFAQRLSFRTAGAGLFLFEDAFALGGVELVELDVQTLPDRRHAGVSDFHVS
jgi:hypothetical protein